MKEYTWGEKPCSDTQCDKELSDPMDLKEHEKATNPKSPKQRGKEFSCMACDKKFPDFNSLSEHDHDHTGEKPFGCTKCNKKFANLVVLKRHKQNHGEQRKSLRLGSFNIGGGLISSKKKRGKEELLLETLSTNKVDIACVQETELEHFDESRPFSLSGYRTFFTQKRSNDNDIKRLLVFVKEGVEVDQRNDLMSPLVSTIWLELSAERGRKTLICGVYREWNNRAGSGQMTPTEQAERFQIITSQIEKAISEGAGVICLGDWNIDLEKMNHESYRLKKVAEVFKSTISNGGMKLLEFGITFQRVHQDGKIIQSALDHIIMNKPDQVNDYFKTGLSYSDHSGIILDIQAGISKNRKGLIRKVRDLRKVRNNPQYLQVALANIDWTKLAAMQDVDEMVNFFIKEIEKVLDRVAPFKNLKNRSKNKFKLKNETLT